MYVQSRDIFAHAERSRERNRGGIQRLKGADMFLPDDDGDNSGGNEAAATSADPVPAPQPSAETAAAEENKNPEPSLYDKQLRANFPVTLDGDVDALIADAKERNPGVEIAEAAPPKAGGRAWTVTLPKPVGAVVAVERGSDGKWMVTDVRAGAAGGGGAQTATHMAIFAAMGRAVNMLEGSGKFALVSRAGRHFIWNGNDANNVMADRRWWWHTSRCTVKSAPSVGSW